VLALSDVQELWNQLVNNDLGLEVPDLDAGGGCSAEPVSVRGENQSVDDVISSQTVKALALNKVPQVSSAVLATGCAQTSIRRNGYGVEVTSVASEVTLKAQVAQLPNLHLLVPTAWYDHWGGLGWGESNARHPLSVAVVHNGVLALTEGIPQLDGLVAGTRHNLSVVSGESNGKNILVVANESAGGLAGSNLPQSEGTIPWSGKSKLSIGWHYNGGYEVGVTAECLASESVVLLGAVNLPNNHGLVAGSRQEHVVVLGRSSDGGDPVGVAHKGAAKSKLLAHGEDVLVVVFGCTKKVSERYFAKTSSDANILQNTVNVVPWYMKARAKNGGPKMVDWLEKRCIEKSWRFEK
jgi:hypothetical protein